MSVEKTVSYKVKFDFSDAEKQAEASAKRQNARLQKAVQPGAKVEPYEMKGKKAAKAVEQFRTAQQVQPRNEIFQNMVYFMRRIVGHNSRLGEFLHFGASLGFNGGRGGGHFNPRIFAGGGMFGGGGRGFITGGGAAGEGGGGVPFARLAGGGGLVTAGLVGLAVTGVTIALKELKDQITNFVKGVALITKSIVTGNTVAALHGMGHIGQAGASVAGMAIGGVLGGAGGFLVGGYLGNKLGGLVHSLIDGLEGIVQALGRFSPIVNAQLAQFRIKQFMFSFQMAQIFQPLMSAWIQLKSFVLDLLFAFGQVIRPLVQMAGKLLSTFVSQLRQFLIGFFYLSARLLEGLTVFIEFFNWFGIFNNLKGVVQSVINGLDKTVGILSRTNGSLNDAASEFIKGFVTSLTKYKHSMNPNAWGAHGEFGKNSKGENLVRPQGGGYHDLGRLAYVAPTGIQQRTANSNDDNKDLAATKDREKQRKEGSFAGREPAAGNMSAPYSPAPPYIPGPNLQMNNSFTNSFNYKISLDEMVERTVSEVRRYLSGAAEESRAETTLASLLVTGAVKGLLV